MSRTVTKLVSFEKLHDRVGSCIPIIRLMMACNDLTLANQALADWKTENRMARKERKLGACMYFVRAELAHVYEGLKVIPEIRQNDELFRLVGRCDPHTQMAFDELLKLIHPVEAKSRLEHLLGKIRNNLTFHYSDKGGKLIKTVLRSRANREGGKWSSITRANTSHQWYWKVADDLVDSIVVREIWKVKVGENTRAETDLILDEVAQIVRLFLDFSGEFIWRFCES